MKSRGSKIRLFLNIGIALLFVFIILIKANILHISWNKIVEVATFLVFGLLILICGYSFVNIKSRQWWLDRVNPNNTNNPMAIKSDDIKLMYILGGWTCIIFGAIFIFIALLVFLRQ